MWSICKIGHMRDSYGQPPFFVPALFFRVLALTVLVVVLTMIGIVVLWEPIDLVDMVGSTVCTPLVAYLIHLWLAPTSD